MPRAVRAQYLRQLGVRIGTELATGLEGVSGSEWRALRAAGEHPIGSAVYQQLDRLTPSRRHELRRAVEHLGADATVADLVRMDDVDWQAVADAWGTSSADWNHVRRMLAAVLTRHFHGDSRHDVRRYVIDAIPLQPEYARVPDMPPRTIWSILEKLPPFARQFPLVLVATGLRIGEYERLEPHHLHHASHTIDVPGTKTEASHDTISVAAELWADVVAAVPSPFRYGWMRRLFRQACEEAGVSGITLHDLRHCHAQWAVDNGADERAVMAQLRHRSIAMTRRYTRTRDTAGAASAAAQHVLASRPGR